MNSIVFIDSEISAQNGRILDLGAVKIDSSQKQTKFHSSSVQAFGNFISGSHFICGHNIISHDLNYIGNLLNKENPPIPIDTLYLSPLIFPCKPYHKLLKNDKLQTEELNNPLNDSIKAMELFYDEVNGFKELNLRIRWIYSALLYPVSGFQGFFQYVGYKQCPISEVAIKKEFEGMLCTNSNISGFINRNPVELAYALALIASNDHHSITPPWVLKNYPMVENILKVLRSTPCAEGCDYCNSKLDIHRGLKRIFGYDSFRTYNGEPLQEMAANAAIHGKSLLAIFPTGGGKSITFQLPALMAGESQHGLTVVISPLQSLMKDQVDNLEKAGIVDAVTVNGLLDPIERKAALERVKNGMATILYISPEQLRSKTIEYLLLSRNVTRFVIDEAHCFSAWGQDFRVDYLYIGDFIRELQEKKKMGEPIPVSCFTATAKQKVISDIRDYFKRKLGLELELYATNMSRGNLHYAVLHKETEEEKYNTLRGLIEQKNCPTIVYVSRTRRAEELAEKLTKDGFQAKPFHGKMDANTKTITQDAFIQNEIKVIVATSAFGMGVDKKDVKLVIHYDISDSLENYIQESGRAGRDPFLEAECYVLYNDNDLDKHFVLLNQTKLSISEIQQVWKGIKALCKKRDRICCSSLEIARQAGWDDFGPDIETRVKTAIAALENAGYVKRGKNVPHVYATSIMVKTMIEAGEKLDQSPLFDDDQRKNARQIIQHLISERGKSKAGNAEAESRIDYLADMLGIEKRSVIEAVNLMRAAGILEDFQDMSAYISEENSQNKSARILERFLRLEKFILSQIPQEGECYNLKWLNEQAQKNGIPFSNVKNIRIILSYWIIKGYTKKGENNFIERTDIIPEGSLDVLWEKFCRKTDISRFVIKELYRLKERSDSTKENILVQFSLYGLYHTYCNPPQQKQLNKKVTLAEFEDALLYLSKTGALQLEGGFLVIYNGMTLERLITDNKIRYKVEDYRTLHEFYKQKIQQIHIVGEYANLMVRNYHAALKFVQDYFQLDYKKFIAKYFKGERAQEIERNITPEKYRQLFGELSDIQKKIINDDQSKYIVAAAGPGSGKTRVLVHKLAALVLLEDVKYEQLLMVTFSRAAATEFKKRLIGLIGDAAYFMEIKTFHSYCFDLLGKVGSLEEVENVVKDAAKMIEDGEVEWGRITKTVMVIDEAQDMDQYEFALVQALMRCNDNMRIIAVGDDDQNIYEFRGSDSKYFQSLISEYGAARYEMTENYRSKANIVALANQFVSSIPNRMKSAPGQAVQKEKGKVQLIHHISPNIEEPIINQILSADRNGTLCVLTNTNDEALRILGLLTEKGICAKLLQSNNGFCLYNLAEIRYFLRIIDKNRTSPVISDAVWDSAKEALAFSYKDSACLDICLKLIADFEQINRVKYHTDLIEFIKESNYEDFYSDDEGIVFISTIHKSKGHEFDTVYMLMNGIAANTNEIRRRIYVGLTRAKNALYIHYNGSLFDGFLIPGVEHIEDTQIYQEPNEIILPLSYRDVFLDFFKGKKKIIHRLHSGAQLQIGSIFLSAKIEREIFQVVKFSQACKERLNKLEKKGYQVYKAIIRFVVAWKGQKDEEESAVILPNLYLKKE